MLLHLLQGDKEAELGLPFSPLCDRTSTLVAQSQIGELHARRLHFVLGLFVFCIGIFLACMLLLIYPGEAAGYS